MSIDAPRVAVIIVAAGAGTRLGSSEPKAFVRVGGRTLLQHALHAVSGMSERAQIVVAVPTERVDSVAAELAGQGTEPVPVVVAGGLTRQASVAASLNQVSEDVAVVLVHDAARALTPADQFDRVVAAVDSSGGGIIPGLPVSDTIKRVDAAGVIHETVDRSQLSAVQTPQGFPRVHLVDAYSAATAEETDDAALVTALGHPVLVIAGDPLAFKITTPSDLRRAEDLIGDVSGGLAAQRSLIGVGTDSHAFGGDGELWVAGLLWSGESGLAGHSDGDPVAHAVTDALLSAAGLGDIGTVFGTDDARFAGAHGDVFLRETRSRLADAGYAIGNVSVQLIGNRPRFTPRREEAQALLSDILGAPVAISATTTDGLGFTGRGEGVAAIATALIHPLG